MAEDENGNYICVHCGNSVDKLYKKYSSSILKLCTCTHCGNVCDKYLEFDTIIVLIDLILFSREAYRHVLYNLQYKGYMKLGFLLLIIISFDEWVHGKTTAIFQESDFYELRFYTVCLATVLGKILFLLLTLFFINAYIYYNSKKNLLWSNIIRILKAVVYSSFGYFLLLTILIWNDPREIRLLFIYVYTWLSQIQALTVTIPIPKLVLGGICTFSNVADQIFSTYLRSSLGVE